MDKLNEQIQETMLTTDSKKRFSMLKKLLNDKPPQVLTKILMDVSNNHIHRALYFNSKIKERNLKPKIEPSNITWLYKSILPQGFLVPLIAETGTGKSILSAYIAREYMLKNPKTKLFIYSQESDWNHNIVPYLMVCGGLSLKDVKERVLFMPFRSFDKDARASLKTLNTLNKGDFVIYDPLRIIVKNANDNSEVAAAVYEIQEIVQKRQLFFMGLHHTTTAWRGSSVKEQGKFAKEWTASPRHTLIAKEKTDGDGDCITFVQKTNLCKREGAITFKIESADVEIGKITLKNKPCIASFEYLEKATTEILKTYFTKKDGFESPAGVSDTTEQVRSLIIHTIRNCANEMSPLVSREIISEACGNAGFTKSQIDHSLSFLVKSKRIVAEYGHRKKASYGFAKTTENYTAEKNEKISENIRPPF